MMRKCNICGKTISDFAENCPYCNSNSQTLNVDNATAAKEKYASKNRNILLWIDIAIILAVSFIPLTYSYKRTAIAWLILLLPIVLSIACVVYSIFVIKKYKVIDVRNNKKAFIISLIIGIIITIVGIGRAFWFSWAFGIDFFVHFPEYLIARIIYSLIGGVLIFCLASNLFCIFGNKQIKSEKTY